MFSSKKKNKTIRIDLVDITREAKNNLLSISCINT